MITRNASASLVSVIIPCYRQGRFLAAAVNSVLAQTYFNVEIIIVDDGSDDDTRCVAESFDGAARYFRRTNGGPAAARNTGIAEARGDYFLFLDADDLLHPEAVTWCVEAARGRPDALCVMGIRHFENDRDLESGRDSLPPVGPEAARKLLVSNLNPPLAFLCPRQMVKAAGGFDPSQAVDACEDWELWSRLFFSGATLVTIPRIGAFYRQHPGSHSRNQIRMARSKAEVIRRTMSRIRRNPGLLAVHALNADAIIGQMRSRLSEELHDAAFHLREEGSYGASLAQYLTGMWRGRVNRRSMLGICKLVPHRILRPFIGRNHPARS